MTQLNWHVGKDGNMYAPNWCVVREAVNTPTPWALHYEDWDGPYIGNYSDDPEVLKAVAQRVDDAMNGIDALTRIEVEAKRLQDSLDGNPTYKDAVRIGKIFDHFDYVSRWLKGES